MRRTPRQQLKDLIELCTVKIHNAGVVGGSGFFVAPGLIISCAHVAADRRTSAVTAVTAGSVTVQWRENTYQGRVRAAPEKAGPGRLWAYPDLCVIELDAVPDHPAVFLGDLADGDNRDLYLAGFTAVYETEPRFQGKSGRLDAPQDLKGGRTRQITDCEMAPGMSGGPVLDVRSGAVCAVVKTTRMEDSNMGGLVIPAEAIRAAFPDVWEKNQRDGEHNRDWLRLRGALLEVTDPLTARAMPGARNSLIIAADRLGLERPDFSALWREIVGELGPEPPAPLEDITDMIAALGDLPQNPLDPFVKLFLLLAIWGKDGWRADLRAQAAKLAGQNRQGDGFTHYRPRDLSHRDHDPVPVILIRLERYGPDQLREVLLTIWRYSAIDGSPKQVSCPPGPHAVREVEKTITAVLAREIPEVSQDSKPMIEFALPDHLLDQAVEKWKVDGWILGVDYRVVVRFTNRTNLEAQAWQARESQFRSARLPSRDSASWRDLWVVCGDPRGRDQLNGLLQASSAIPMVALTAWHRGKPVPPAVTAARHAGAPVIVWQHRQCADHRVSASNGSGAACRGHRFQEAVAEQLSGVPLTQLPEKVRQARAAAGRNGSTDPRQNIAILWDDPGRSPWADAPRNHPPAPTE